MSGASELEARVGHPGRLKAELIDRIQTDGLRTFTQVQDAWLELMWSLDSFRIAGLTPSGMGKGGDDGFDGVYRGKGNWFAEILSLLLNNQTGHLVGSRTRVQGFSQIHQIDLAWPARKVDPLVCAESKVTGGPAYGNRPARGATSDWTNRRKELKFAATDLKLARRQQQTSIEHWDVWRSDAPPKCFFLWAARLDPRRDSIDRMTRELQALVNTYLDGAGLFAWTARADDDGGEEGYRPVELAADSRVSDLDDVLYRIASEIRKAAGADGSEPPPVEPANTAVDPDSLAPDPE